MANIIFNCFTVNYRDKRSAQNITKYFAQLIQMKMFNLQKRIN